MFDWLFEKEIYGQLFFKTEVKKFFENMYEEPMDKFVEVRKICMRHESAKVYLRYRATMLIPEELYNKCHLSLNEDVEQQISYTEGGEISWVITVKCWEGAWNELKKLPWVTGTSEVIQEA